MPYVDGPGSRHRGVQESILWDGVLSLETVQQ